MLQKATIYVTNGEDGPSFLTHALMEEAPLVALREDWLNWLKSGKPGGGVYRYKSSDVAGIVAGDDRELFLRFSEIKAIF